MSRAQGKKNTPREVSVTPESAEGRNIGLSDRQLGTPSPIPGGDQHLLNRQTMRQKAPIPAPKPEYRGMMAHGVPAGTHSAHERADAMRGPNATHDPKPRYHKAPEEPAPIPVKIVSNGNGDTFRTASPYHFTLPAQGSDPIRLCGRDYSRKEVHLLNESSSSNIRFATRPSDLNNNGGALLPWPTNSYLKIETQDELYAVSADTGTPIISVIQVTEREK
jgi:hypothetical protein